MHDCIFILSSQLLPEKGALMLEFLPEELQTVRKKKLFRRITAISAYFLCNAMVVEICTVTSQQERIIQGPDFSIVLEWL